MLPATHARGPVETLGFLHPDSPVCARQGTLPCRLPGPRRKFFSSHGIKRPLPVFLPIETSLWAVAAWATYTFAWQSEAEFIYFQF